MNILNTFLVSVIKNRLESLININASRTSNFSLLTVKSGIMLNKKISEILNDLDNFHPGLIAKVMKDNVQTTNHVFANSEIIDRLFILIEQNIVSLAQGHRSVNDYQELQKLIPQIDQNHFCEMDWLKLSYVATANGLYEIGYKFRLKSSNIISSKPIGNIDDYDILLEIFSESFDSINFERAYSVIDKIDNMKASRELKESCKFHYAIMTNNSIMKKQIYNSRHWSKSDKNFANYIHNKRIAVVGPAPNNELTADEIDQFDIVINVNYRGKENMPPIDEFGSKINVSYYNPNLANDILENSDGTFLSDLDFAVFRNKLMAKKFKKKYPNSNPRVIQVPNRFLFSGRALMIPMILYDLLIFEPAEIKLFKVNFYMTKQKYHKNYYELSDKKRDMKLAWKENAFNDLIGQLNFTRAIMLKNNIKADTSTLSVLNTKNEEYIRFIQNNYSY